MCGRLGKTLAILLALTSLSISLVSSTASAGCFNLSFRWALRKIAPHGYLGRIMPPEESDRVRQELAAAIRFWWSQSRVPAPQSHGFTIPLERVYFSQVDNGKHMVFRSRLEMYFNRGFENLPILIEVPLREGDQYRFVYLVYEGHHRIAADILRGITQIEGQIWTLQEASQHVVTKEEVLSMAQNATKHLNVESN